MRCAVRCQRRGRAVAERGKADIDLIRSVMVLDDVGGKQLGEFLKTGRPAKNMPALTLTDEQVSDIAAFLHANIAQVSERGAYKYLDVYWSAKCEGRRSSISTSRGGWHKMPLD